MLFLSKWKWYIISAAFIAYSAGVWHVSSTYATASLTKAELERTQANNELAAKTMKALGEDQQKYAALARQLTKDIANEILKDPVYKSCRVTDGVRDAIKRKLDSQPD
jgi:hypothetical protein